MSDNGRNGLAGECTLGIMTAWTPQDIETLKKLAEAGASPLRIAARLKRRMSAIRTVAYDHGIKLKTKGEVRESYGLSSRWQSRRKG
jgi:hypothetical protein